jgi:hypothetical protein
MRLQEPQPWGLNSRREVPKPFLTAATLGWVGQNLTALVRCKPELRQDLFPLGDSVSRRSIAGTNRPSPHNWGIGIDLNPQGGAYWRWQKSPTAASILTLRRSYPREIVKIFEDQGFIWGGKWSHYDFMHFEYRAGLLVKTPPAGTPSGEDFIDTRTSYIASPQLPPPEAGGEGVG